MEKYPTLIPNPRQLIFTGDLCNIANGKILQLVSNQPQPLLLPANGSSGRQESQVGSIYFTILTNK